jgi:hypothetical protein
VTWWYNTESGKITDYGGPVGDVQQFFQQFSGDVGLGAGWHQLPIPASDTLAQAQAYVAKAYPAGAKPTTSDVTAEGQAVTQEAGASQLIPGLQQVGQFFGALAQGSTWIRVAEGILGIILIAVGLARITHAVPIATKIAGAVA